MSKIIKFAKTIKQRRDSFRRMHESGCFVIPNPWSPGSAKYLAHQGFKALATTSSGFAWSQGKADGTIALPIVLEHLTAIVNATDLPINADFESGFGNNPDEVYLNVKAALACGVAGISLEDSDGIEKRRLRTIDDSVQRLGAARAAVDEVDKAIVLVARAENFFFGNTDMRDTLRRLEAYAAAGADCLYAPGLTTKEEIKEVLRVAHPLPVNVLIGKDLGLSVHELAGLGVRRISVGGALARAAWTGLEGALKSILTNGTFEGFRGIVSGQSLNELFREKEEGSIGITNG